MFRFLPLGIIAGLDKISFIYKSQLLEDNKTTFYEPPKYFVEKANTYFDNLKI
jgi:hypothetical protein